MVIVRDHCHVVAAILISNVHHLSSRTVDYVLVGTRCGFLEAPTLTITAVGSVLPHTRSAYNIRESVVAGIDWAVAFEQRVKHLSALDAPNRYVLTVVLQLELLVFSADVVIQNKVADLVTPIIGLRNVEASASEFAADYIWALPTKVIRTLSCIVGAVCVRLLVPFAWNVGVRVWTRIESGVELGIALHAVDVIVHQLY